MGEIPNVEKSQKVEVDYKSIQSTINIFEEVYQYKLDAQDSYDIAQVDKILHSHVHKKSYKLNNDKSLLENPILSKINFSDEAKVFLGQIELLKQIDSYLGAKGFLALLKEDVLHASLSVEEKTEIVNRIEFAIAFMEWSKSKTNDITDGWWRSWGKCVAGIVGGTLTGGVMGAAAGGAFGTVALPLLGTVSGASLGMVVGAIGGGLSGAALACD
ncbi:hypothetical protein K4L44_17450 [Halosquirtibacter laminarini]|uniref:Uncharacterized protein n=1 Tax=Halosquirtibacter laminarini TaxID=3374600 RepID=A0AC61NF84_9BACT|nr:hypothetical protein K4L44_17450 [Prolixibacteraceae bacterium]